MTDNGRRTWAYMLNGCTKEIKRFEESKMQQTTVLFVLPL